MPKIEKREDLPDVSEESKVKLNLALAEPCKYEIKKTDTFKIEFGLQEKENRYIIIEDMNVPERFERHWVEFRIWNYEEEIDLKKKSMLYDAVKRMHFLDNDVYNSLKIMKLLKDWSFAVKNERLKIHHSNGVLTDGCWEIFVTLKPNIVSYIIVRMNNVLEYNG